MKLAKKVLRKAVNDRLVYLRNQIELGIWFKGNFERAGALLILDRLDLDHIGAFNPEMADVYNRIDYHLGICKAWINRSKREYKKALELSQLSDSDILKMSRTQAGR